MNDKSKKLSILLTLAIILCLFAAMPLTVSAASSDNIIDLSENWFGSADRSTFSATWEYKASTNTIKIHGGVTVIGTVTGTAKSLTLDIDPGVKAVWKANYSGSVSPLIKLNGGDVFEVAQGGALKNIGTGYTIDVNGTVRVLVSGGTVSSTSTAIFSNKAATSITVSGGTVECTGNSPAINANGSIEVSDGTVSSTGSSAAILAINGNTVTISGGLVKNTGTGVAISSNSDGASVTISGGVVESEGSGQTISAGRDMTMSGGTVRNTGTSAAIIVSRNLDITDGIVSATTAPAIATSGASASVTVSGGFVFAYGTSIVRGDTTLSGTYIINSQSNPVRINGNAVVCAWNQAAGHRSYAEGSSDDLTTDPIGAAVWGKRGSQKGIIYDYDENRGFFAIDGITINSAPTVYKVTFNTNGGSAVSEQIVNAGEKAAKPADPAKTGFDFAGWYTTSALTTEYNFNNTVRADTTLYAKWTDMASTPTPAPTPGLAQKNSISLKINNPYMYVNGEEQEIDPGRGTVPIIFNSRTVLPIRAIVEAMGGTVGWDDETRTVTLAANGHTVTMWLDKLNLVVDGKNLIMDVAPISINGRTMVPVRFAAENLGCDVDWIDADKEVIILY